MKDPREAGPKPPFPKQKQKAPGVEREMVPRPDHGEESYVGHGRLTDRIALITGGDSGIGRAVALAYAREGADMLLSYQCEDSDAQDTLRLVEDAGRSAVPVPGDIGREGHCRQLVERTVQEFGKLDILVNLAAFSHNRPSILEMPSEEWDYTFKTNLYSMFYLCKAAIPHLKPGSVILNTASVEAFEPDPNALAYSTTKGAIVTFTKALAREVINQGIRANVVCPGPTWTPIIVTSMEPEKSSGYGLQTPMKRPAQPRELAPMYVFLASDDASFITGEVFVVAGGMPLPS
jgi:NAD(P)-dependent dehydrogenase (short-subunit alcohol dehydrogenase family)